MKTYKVLFADLDGTLIETISGEPFPKGIWDMRLKLDVLDKIKSLNPLYVFIVSNQGGIESGFVDRFNFVYKSEYITRAIREYTGITNVQYDFCPSNNSDNSHRKPNCGMLEQMWRDYILAIDEVKKEDCLMIGDASGKEGQFSDSDRKTAENFGIDYLDMSDFVKASIWYDEIVPVENIKEWRKKHPGKVSVRVQHSDGIAIWDFECIDPDTPEGKRLINRQGGIMGNGTTIFYDSEGTKHTIPPSRPPLRKPIL